jgi:N-acetylmuramoyl-L-alanine amidase
MAKWFIFPGHGGKDSGATGNGLIEKDINLVVSLELKRVLVLNGQKVKMARTNDTFVDLQKGYEMANTWNAEYCISPHENAGGGDGFEVIYQLRGGKSKQLAELIAEEFKALGQNLRKVYSRESDNRPGQDYYAGLSIPKCPAVITEFAFIDNKNDAKSIDTKAEQKKVGQAIAKACLKLIGIQSIKI